MEYELIFSTAFLVQVLSISALLPWIVRRKIMENQRQYPESTHPNLYPKGAGWHEKCLFRFTLLSFIACMIGLFFWLVYNSDTTNTDYDGVVWAVFMMQSLPYVYLEMMTVKHWKHMREADTRRKRIASLSPRGLKDILSSGQLISLSIFFLGFCGFIHYVDQLNIPWFGGWLNVAILLGSFVFMVGILSWNVRGRSRDPYMNETDFLDQTRRIASQLILVSHALIVYAFVVISLEIFELQELKQLAMSIYGQGLMLGYYLLMVRKPSVDFSVYREDSIAENQPSKLGSA